MDQTIKDKDLLRRHVKVQVLRSHPIECTEYMHATAGGLAFLLPDRLVALLVCYLVLLCTSPCLDWSITSSDPGVLYGARFVHLLVGDDRSIDARRAWWPAATITGGLPPRARATTARDLRGRQVSRISRSRAGRQVDGSDGWSVISLILSPAVPRAGTSYVDEKRDTYVMVRLDESTSWEMTACSALAMHAWSPSCAVTRFRVMIHTVHTHHSFVFSCVTISPKGTRYELWYFLSFWFSNYINIVTYINNITPIHKYMMFSGQTR
jgi:hypothetical protein